LCVASKPEDKYSYGHQPRDPRGRHQRRDLEDEESERTAHRGRNRARSAAAFALGASIVHAHNSDIALTGQADDDDYLAAWRPILAVLPLRPGIRR
jgi:hypothetical protein